MKNRANLFIDMGIFLTGLMHQYLHKHLMRSNYLVQDLYNPNRPHRLYRAVGHLNSYNVILAKKSRSEAAKID